jgi:hypothetical protein
MRMGLHVDWASGFPFEELGLTDNYALALPSLWAYGFDYDASFPANRGERIEAGVEAAAAIFRRKTAAAGLRPAAYKMELRLHYREMLAEVRRNRPDGGKPE